MPYSALTKLTIRYASVKQRWQQARSIDHSPGTESGFEIAQSMGIALLGLVVAAAFATALQALGVDVIDRIRTEMGL